MNSSSVQIIEKDGDPQFAVVPIETYREIVARLEDIEDYAAIEQTMLDDRDGRTVPGETVNAILSGVSPLRAWREYYGIKLESLAKQVGVSKSYLSQIENRRKSGTLALYCRISVVLEVPIDDLVEWTEEH